jgi:O-acetyl-ADP-ribose deacetylase (regulator of RNase III)
MKEAKIRDKTIALIKGNIALLEVEAVVNAANTSLILGGGVAGAILKFGGEKIQEECNKLAPIKAGEVVITSGGNLKARHVIHAVGPRSGEGQEEEKLRRATLNSLKTAAEKRIRSIAFPAISTGIFGFALERCSRIMISAVMEFLKINDFPKEVVFCLYDDEALNIFERALEELAETSIRS